MDIAEAFEVTGAKLTITNTLQHALILVEHDGLAGAILDHALGDGAALSFAHVLKSAASLTSSLAVMPRLKARVRLLGTSANRLLRGSLWRRWKASSRRTPAVIMPLVLKSIYSSRRSRCSK